MTTLTRAEYDRALANCTRAEKDLLRRLVKGPHPEEAIRLLELKNEFPSAQLVEERPEDKKAITLKATGRVITRDEQLSAVWTEEAIAEVDANSPELWKQAAMAAIEKVCRTKRYFTPDDIWSTGLEKPPNPRALGPRMQEAQKRDWCHPTGAFVPSTIPTQHSNPIREWESHLVPKDEEVSDEIGIL